MNVHTLYHASPLRHPWLLMSAFMLQLPHRTEHDQERHGGCETTCHTSIRVGTVAGGFRDGANWSRGSDQSDDRLCTRLSLSRASLLHKRAAPGRHSSKVVYGNQFTVVTAARYTSIGYSNS